MNKENNNKLYLMMLFPSFILVVLFTFFPIIQIFLLAFRKYNFFNLSDTRFIGFGNFQAIFADTYFNFTKLLLNTFLWIVVSLFFQFVFGFGLALLLKTPFKGRGIYSGLVFYPWALSGFAIGLVWSWMFNGQFGIINDILIKLGIINEGIGFLSDPRFSLMSVIISNIWYGIPFFGIMLLAALQMVPMELYEAAEIDGAGDFTKLFKITIPYIKPTIVSTVLLRSIWIMNSPELIYGMTRGGPANSSNILTLNMIIKIFTLYDFGGGSALAIIIILITSIYIIIYLKITSSKELKF